MASGPYPDERRGTWSVQYFDGLKWCRKVVVRKRPGWKPGDPMPKKPPPEAIAALAEYSRREQVARERGKPTERQSVAAFLEGYRSSYANSMEPASVTELDKAIKLFLAWCDPHGIARMEQVTPSACHRWLKDRGGMISRKTGKPISHATLTKERALLAAAWAQAARRKEIEDDPWSAAPVPGKPSARKKGAWSPDDYRKLLTVCRPWLRDLLILGCNTGLRIEALIGLEWKHVEWAGPDEKHFGYVVVPPELDKAKKGYRVPINAALHNMLARRHTHHLAHQARVMTGQGGKPIGHSNSTDSAIRTATAKAGLNDEHNPISSPNHHMRRTFGRWAVLGHLTGKPVPLYVVSRWLGHASVAMTMKYLDLRDDDSARFMMGEDDEAPTR